MSGLDELDIDGLFGAVAGASKLGLAVSGGPDSLALMLLAADWARAPGRPELVVYSVDHGLRPEAPGEVAMVLREASARGLAARALRWEGEKPSTGIQAAARSARYRLMAEAMRADGADILLTAHHREDQAETVLMRLAHGSGIEGLKGMLPMTVIEGVTVARPLLGTARETLRAVVAAAGLAAADDPSNADDHYERVRWRQLMPDLEAMGLDAERLGRFAERMADADDALAQMAASLIAKWAERNEGLATLPRAQLMAAPKAVAVKALGRLLSEVGGAGKGRDLGRIEELYLRLAATERARASTLHGCVVESDGITVSVRREGARRAGQLLTAD